MSGEARPSGARRALARLRELDPRKIGGAERRRVVLVVGTVLFAAVVATLLITDHPTELVSILFVLPIALVAVELGIGAGIATAAAAIAAVAAWDLGSAPDLGFFAYLARLVAFAGLAAIAGGLAAGVRQARSIQDQLIEAAPDAQVGVDEEGRIILVNAQAERLFGYERQELMGRPIETLIPDDAHEHHPGFVRDFFLHPRTRPINVAVGLRGRHWLGHEFPCEVSLSALDAGGRTIALAAVRDVTERTRADEELRRAFRRLQATTEIARAIGGETELETVLDTIVERGRALVEAKGLIVMLVEGNSLVVAATAGNVESGIAGMRVPLAGLTARVVSSLRPERVNELESMPGMPAGRGERAPTAAILVPLEFRGTALGLVAAFDRRDGPAFSEEDERLLIAFAASAATAVATARDVAQDRLRRTIEAAERERKRWARELHDETLQGLGALRVALASALRGRSEEDLREVVSTAVDELAEEIRALRSLISELRPAALDELGLAAALETLSERSASLVGLEMDTEVRIGAGEGGGRLAPELESTIYRLAQEALSNVAKHARAERVSLKVTETDGYVDVEVSDDGVGFDPDEPGAGFGLMGMRERVEMAGGMLEVRSAPGRGATVVACLPTGEAKPALALEKPALQGVADELGAGRAP